MTYWIVGAGGIGCAIGGKLAAHQDLIFVDWWQEHVDAINSAGLTVDYPDGTINVRVPAVHVSQIHSIGAAPEVVLLAVKSYQTIGAVNLLLPYLEPETMVVSLQNCINEEAIAEIVGQQRTIGAMVRFDGALRGPGHSSATRRERRLVIGELNGKITTRVEVLCSVLAKSVRTEVTDNIWGQLWSKLVANSQVNGVATVTGLTLGKLVSDPVALRFAISCGLETVRVALKLGIRLDREELFGDPEDYLKDLGTPEVNNIESGFRHFLEAYLTVKPSMLQDVEKGRPTEIDYMNGHVVKKGAEVGVVTPMNREIVRLVKEVEAGRRRPDYGAVHELLAPLIPVARQ